MRELSEMLQKLYPTSPDRLPARPWWRFVRVRGVEDDFIVSGYFVRNDGEIVEGVEMPHNGSRGVHRRPDVAAWVEQLREGISDSCLGDGDDADEVNRNYRRPLTEIERIDEENPLSHPGLRAGQVWAFGGGIVSDLNVLTISTHYIDDAEMLHVKLVGLDGLTGMPEEALELILTGEGYFLLADPCCPHLAPWSPT